MVYVTSTYPPMVPYLKGFHLSLEMWRGGRDAEGWKLKPSKPGEIREEEEESIVSEGSLGSLDASRGLAHGVDPERASTMDHLNPSNDEEAALGHKLRKKSVIERRHGPASGLTPAVPRLLKDVEALMKMTATTLPALRVVRPTQVVQVFYGFGDALGKQVGATVSRACGGSGKLSDG